MVQKIKHKHFDKDMILTKVANKISRTLIIVIFVMKSTLQKTFIRNHCHIT